MHSPKVASSPPSSEASPECLCVNLLAKPIRITRIPQNLLTWDEICEYVPKAFLKSGLFPTETICWAGLNSGKRATSPYGQSWRGLTIMVIWHDSVSRIAWHSHSNDYPWSYKDMSYQRLPFLSKSHYWASMFHKYIVRQWNMRHQESLSLSTGIENSSNSYWVGSITP